MQVNLPQVRVVAGDVVLPNVIAVKIDTQSYFSAGRFSVEIALDTGFSTLIEQIRSLDLQTVTVDIAEAGAGFIAAFIGQIDNVRYDALNRVASLSGRDLSARFIDSQIAQTFVNQTSSQVVALLAARRQLEVNVTATTTPVGQYYELDHTRTAQGSNPRASTEWNLLCWLAQIEGFVLSMSGTTLNFGPAQAGIPVSMSSANFSALQLDTGTAIPNCTTVLSWNTREKMVISQTAGDPSGLAASIIRPNLTAATADSIAANYLRSLSQHVTVMSGTMPGDLVLQPGALIALAGTQTAFDLTYEIVSMKRVVDARKGFIQMVRGYAVAEQG